MLGGLRGRDSGSMQPALRHDVVRKVVGCSSLLGVSKSHAAAVCVVVWVNRIILHHLLLA